ncbi:GNAT family N-acetyltransferase [Amycolatopsis sp. 195334CR]|nr:GNAT family N-acetyltransferase [Amycolatopsis sp. 195334CR]
MPAGAVERLFSPARTWEVTPLLDAGDVAGLRALLPTVRVRLLAERPGPDSACVLAWPSLDAPVAGVLPRHGFLPRTAIGVRTSADPGTDTGTGTGTGTGTIAHGTGHSHGPGTDPGTGHSHGPGTGISTTSTGHAGSSGPPGLLVRPAKEADLEELLALEVAELRYAALVGTARPLDNAARLLEPGLRRLLAEGHVWLAEADGLAVGMASTRCVLPEAGGPLANRLPGGRWGYVSTLSVAEDSRGRGVGRALMAVAHRALAESGVRGTFLFYNPCNPLSSVFWHRQGYRPLWTIWDVTPAGEMRA